MLEKPQTYIIHGGQEGSNRLKILAQATFSSSCQLFDQLKISSGNRCLDVGCGNGIFTMELARRVGETGFVTGIDSDAISIQIAKEEAIKRGLSINWQIQNLETSFNLGEYDFIYARFILSHLRQPNELIQKLRSFLKPGGIIAIEDVDFDGHFSYPPNIYFNRYVELYRKTGQLNGADPLIGPKLPALLSNSDFSNIEMKVILPIFQKGDGKKMAELTLKNIQKSIVKSELASQSEIDNLINQLEIFTNDPSSIISLPRIFQVWATK